ncbi:MAG TPA: glycosyltransferase [Chitinivibrionales bacterium]|nr:glycosyltransferase [Chitinivibrionales bacterium]
MPPRDALISVVIVNFRVADFLKRTLLSLREAELYQQSEIIIVDNASHDDSRKKITGEFPEVKWVGLKNNIGFGKACNVGAKTARGTYILFLNPDTLVSRNTLSACVEFLKSRTSVGIMGPKIINADGSLQAGCRRSFPSPAVAFYRLTGLSRLFPKSRRFGRYNLTYLDPDDTVEVDAVSGSFMFMPLGLFREVGGFDERYFMYGEDLDLCRRVKEKGLSVWYNPATQIIHFKGRSAAKLTWKSRRAFYEAMIIFSRTYKHTHAAYFPGWLIFMGIMLQAGLNFVGSLFRTFTACFIDLLLINVILWGGILVRFSLSSMQSPYRGGSALTMVFMHLLLSFSFLGIFLYRGVYSKERYSVGNALVSGAVASAIFMAAVFFVNSMAFSRIAFGVATIVIILALVAWREVLPRAVSRLRRIVFSTGNVVIVGSDEVATALIKNFEADSTVSIRGVLWPVKEQFPGEFEGYPVLGHIENIKDVLSRGRVDLLLIATAQPWYSHVIEALATVKVQHLTIRWVPTELFGQTRDKLPDVIPLRDFSV